MTITLQRYQYRNSHYKDKTVSQPHNCIVFVLGTSIPAFSLRQGPKNGLIPTAGVQTSFESWRYKTYLQRNTYTQARTNMNVSASWNFMDGIFKSFSSKGAVGGNFCCPVSNAPCINFAAAGPKLWVPSLTSSNTTRELQCGVDILR